MIFWTVRIGIGFCGFGITREGDMFPLVRCGLVALQGVRGDLVDRMAEQIRSLTAALEVARAALQSDRRKR